MDRKRILEIGLQMEKSARDFYTSAVAKVVNPGTKKMLRELAEQEEMHVTMFEDALAGKDVEFGKGAPEAGQSLGLGETLEAPQISDAKDPGDILVIAIKAEMRAIKFYQESAAAFAGTDVEKMLLGLVAEEQVHKDRLERIYDEEYLSQN